MSEILYGNVKIVCIYYKRTSKRPEKNNTNDFRINFRYVFVHAKRLCQWNARKCSIKEDFNQNDSLSFS